MPAVITQRWSGTRHTRNVSGQLVFDVTEVTDAGDAIDEVQSTEYAVGDAFPFDATLYADRDSFGVERLSPTHYVVTVGFLPASVGTITSDPTSQKWKVRVEVQESADAVDRDRYGNPIASSTFAPFDDVVTRPAQSLLVYMSRWQTSYSYAANEAYFNKMNSGVVALPKLGNVQARQLLCKGIYIANEFAADDSYVYVTYKFEARRYFEYSGGTTHGFHVWKLDQSRTGYFDTGTIGNILLPNGELPNTTPLIDGFGAPINADLTIDGEPPVSPVPPLASTVLRDQRADAVYLGFDLTAGEADYTGLSIASNL